MSDYSWIKFTNLFSKKRENWKKFWVWLFVNNSHKSIKQKERNLKLCNCVIVLFWEYNFFRWSEHLKLTHNRVLIPRLVAKLKNSEFECKKTIQNQFGKVWMKIFSVLNLGCNLCVVLFQFLCKFRQHLQCAVRQS